LNPYQAIPGTGVAVLTEEGLIDKSDPSRVFLFLRFGRRVLEKKLSL
jgi:hypothetical protein